MTDLEPVQIDWDKVPLTAKPELTAEQVGQLRAMAQVGTSLHDMARSLRISEDALIDHFQSIIEEAQAIGRVKLLNTLSKHAEKSPETALVLAREQLGFTRTR